jgi:hypothetical protein
MNRLLKTLKINPNNPLKIQKILIQTFTTQLEFKYFNAVVKIWKNVEIAKFFDIIFSQT